MQDRQTTSYALLLATLESTTIQCPPLTALRAGIYNNSPPTTALRLASLRARCSRWNNRAVSTFTFMSHMCICKLQQYCSSWAMCPGGNRGVESLNLAHPRYICRRCAKSQAPRPHLPYRALQGERGCKRLPSNNRGSACAWLTQLRHE